jgi:hypothetical protein
MLSEITSRRPVFHRLVAVLGVALVMLLSVLAVRPDLHEAFCHHHDSVERHNAAGNSDEDGCVVTHFARGHVLALALLLLLLIGAVSASEFLFPKHCCALVPFDYQLPPGCGPPLV